MSGFAIGSTLGIGVPGGLTRHTGNHINVYSNTSAPVIKFGAPVFRDGEGCKGAVTDEDGFLGVALRITKTNDSYSSNEAQYNRYEAVDVLVAGGVAVNCLKDATAQTDPAAGGAVYIRKANGAFVAAAEGGGNDTIKLNNAIWARSGRDAEGLAEITLLTRQA